MCIPNGIIPIHWFGDRRAYEKSKLKIITVGLNPSDKEFRENTEQPFSTELRFPHFQSDKPKSLTATLNAYFKTNPYKRWFNAFENVLNGIGGSYYDKEKYPYRALHTDICSPWATTPTWSKLSDEEQEMLYAEGHREWVKLIEKLNPDIILASIAKKYINRLGIESTGKMICRFDRKNDGTPRKYPVEVICYKYCDKPLINCSLLCNAHTGLSKESKIQIATEINRYLKRRWKHLFPKL